LTIFPDWGAFTDTSIYGGQLGLIDWTEHQVTRLVGLDGGNFVVHSNGITNLL
jgi:hypothetical protein